MDIRRPRAGEALALRDLRLRALADAPLELGDFLDEERAFPPDYWDGVVRFAADRDADRVCFVAAGDQGLAGMAGASVTDGVAGLVALWVEPAARGRGAARGLIAAVVDWARRRSAARIDLWVVDGNDAAERLYARAGFGPTGVRQPVPWAPERTESRLTLAL
jgi:GNAT superfamily N-acetyltransferase